jgi:putative transposase
LAGSLSRNSSGTGEHLVKCIVYIDLNMVRAGTVNHPAQWTWCGYNEIQKTRRKNILIDHEKLKELAVFDSFEDFQMAHRKLIEHSLATYEKKRESHWTESIAIGSDTYIQKVFLQLNPQVRGRHIIENGKSFKICEAC